MHKPNITFGLCLLACGQVFFPLVNSWHERVRARVRLVQRNVARRGDCDDLRLPWRRAEATGTVEEPEPHASYRAKQTGGENSKDLPRVGMELLDCVGTE